MTVSTATRFVNTPFGVGVVEGCDAWRSFARFEDGSRRWVLHEDCELDAPRPDWYREPELCDLPGAVA